MDSRERRQSRRWLPYATLVAISFVFAGVIAGTRGGGYERKENSAEQNVAQQASLAQRGDEAG